MKGQRGVGEGGKRGRRKKDKSDKATERSGKFEWTNLIKLGCCVSKPFPICSSFPFKHFLFPSALTPFPSVLFFPMLSFLLILDISYLHSSDSKATSFAGSGHSPLQRRLLFRPDFSLPHLFQNRHRSNEPALRVPSPIHRSHQQRK